LREILSLFLELADIIKEKTTFVTSEQNLTTAQMLEGTTKIESLTENLSGNHSQMGLGNGAQSAAAAGLEDVVLSHAKTIMPRSAKSVSEAQELIRPMIGKLLINNKLKITATISGNSLGKLGSQSATDKSISPALHAKAIANVDVLFQNAAFDVAHKDESGREGIEQIHRLGSLMFDETSDEYVPIMITIKEFNNNRGSRIYTLEAVDIEKTKSAGLTTASNINAVRQVPIADFEKSVGQLVGDNHNESRQTPIADFIAKIQQLIEDTKQKQKNHTL
jgi:hypothetical protein